MYYALGMDIGKNIRLAREAAGINQTKLGQLCGYGEDSQARISHYETGRRAPTPSDTIKLEDALELHRGALIGAEPPQDNLSKLKAGQIGAVIQRAALSDADNIKLIRGLLSQLEKSLAQR